MLTLSIKSTAAFLAFVWMLLPGNEPQAHYEKGKAAFYTGQYAECISELKLCGKDTAFKDCSYLIAMSHLNLAQYGQAIPCFKQAIALQRNNYNAYMQMAACCRALHKNGKAKKLYARLLHVQPAYYPACYEKGDLAFEAGKYKKAIALYEQALLLKPGFEKAFYRLGYCYLVQKDTLRACSYWSKIQDLDDFKNYEAIGQMIAAHTHS